MATASLVPQDQTVVEFDVRTDEMLVNMGPQHPSTHGVLRLVLRTDGELIPEVVPHLGYLHRSAAQLGATDLCKQFLDYFEPRIPEYHTLLTTNHICVNRTANIGNCSKELAIQHACSGPMMRGSLDRRNGDPDWDLRKLEPYCGYETYDFN